MKGLLEMYSVFRETTAAKIRFIERSQGCVDVFDSLVKIVHATLGIILLKAWNPSHNSECRQERFALKEWKTSGA